MKLFELLEEQGFTVVENGETKYYVRKRQICKKEYLTTKVIKVGQYLICLCNDDNTKAVVVNDIEYLLLAISVVEAYKDEKATIPIRMLKGLQEGDIPIYKSRTRL